MTSKIRSFIAAVAALACTVGAAAQQSPSQAPPPPSGASSAAVAAELEKAMKDGPKGMLAVRAIQGTRGGPPVTGDETEILFFHRDMPVKQVKTVLDEQGLIMVDDLPVAIGLRPLVRVKHAGVFYQNIGAILDASKPHASMEVTVYEVTETMPAWKVLMRHVVAAKSQDGVDVSETLVVENPTDQTWLGTPADREGRRATVSVTLPPEASEVRLDKGFHGWCCTAFRQPELVVQMPFMPGKATYQFSYHVMAHEGAADLRMSAPAPIERAAFFVPEAGMQAAPTLALDAGSETMGDQRARMFRAEGVPANQLVGVMLTGLAPAAALPTSSPTSANDSMTLWSFGGIIVVIIVVIFVMRLRRNAK